MHCLRNFPWLKTLFLLLLMMMMMMLLLLLLLLQSSAAGHQHDLKPSKSGDIHSVSALSGLSGWILIFFIELIGSTLAAVAAGLSIN